MKLIINKSIYDLTLLALMAISVASGMDQKEIVLTGTLYIDDTMETALYAPQQHFKDHISKSSFQASQVDPFMRVKIKIENNPADDTVHKILIPAKCLFNFNDGSEINFVFGKYKVKATCARNPLILNGKDFEAQFTHNMENFYEKPCFTDEKELIDKDILTVPTSYEFHFNPNGEGIGIPGELRANYGPCKHGPNGCANEKRFIELMAAKQTKAYGNSMHQLAIQRQYGKPLARPKNEASKHGDECTVF